MDPKWTEIFNKKGKNYKSLISLLITISLLILIPIGIYLVKQAQVFKPKAQQTGVSVYLKPSYQNLYEPVLVNQNVVLNVIADSDKSFDAVDLRVNFDKDLLQVLSVVTAESGVPKYCGGLTGQQCPAGYYCKPQDPPEFIADVPGTCELVPSPIPSRSLPPVNDVTPTPNGAPCKRTGCSGTVCSDQDVMTTCEYREIYACYGQAECKRQGDGNCGWTMTETLSSCLGQTGTKQENERCDENRYSCAQGLECRDICEPTPQGAVCNAYGMVCKKPKTGSLKVEIHADQGYLTISGSVPAGTADNRILATITLKTVKVGTANLSFDNTSRLLSGGTNILDTSSGLAVIIEAPAFCASDNECKGGYYCDTENRPKYCAINDCPDKQGICRPKQSTRKGDGNGDGRVDLADLSILFSYFFKNNPEIDFNSDGTINSLDYGYLINILKSNGTVGGPGTGGGSGTVCAQVQTKACIYEQVQCFRAPCDPVKRCQTFATPCDVPDGWVIE